MSLKYKWLLFDADDTLLDFKKAEHTAIKMVLEDLSLPAGEKIISTYSLINDSLWKALERGEIEKDKLRVVRFERFCEELGFSADPKGLAQTYMECLSTKPYVFDGAIELCRELSKHYRMYPPLQTVSLLRNRVR